MAFLIFVLNSSHRGKSYGLVRGAQPAGEDEYEEGGDYYEDGYEDEEEEDAAVDYEGTTRKIEPDRPFRGYHIDAAVGGGVNTVQKKLVDDTYLAETAKVYDCLTNSMRWPLEPLKAANENKEDDGEDGEDEGGDGGDGGEGVGDDEDNAESAAKREELKQAIANGTDLGGLDTKKKVKKVKKLTYREKQHMAMEERRKKQAEKEIAK